MERLKRVKKIPEEPGSRYPAGHGNTGTLRVWNVAADFGSLARVPETTGF